jgi:POT family proton-dependent oligopeptide transporter
MAGLQTDTAFAAGLSEELNDEVLKDEKLVHHESDSEDNKPATIGHGDDNIHDGLVFPTAEERATLRRVPDSIPWNAYRQYLSILSTFLVVISVFQ